MKRYCFIVIVFVFLVACAPQIVPKNNASGVINPIDNSLSLTQKSIKISIRAQDLEVAPYRLDQNITSFYLELENLSDKEILFPLDSILLIDSDGYQYRPIPPSEVLQTISHDSTYLIPYPYVGFYYLEDQVNYAATNSLGSSIPYHYENYPQDLYTESLPVGAVLPGAKIGGVVYFMIDLYFKNDIDIRIYLPGTSFSSPPDFAFPFSVEK